MIFNKLKSSGISEYKFDINQILYKVSYNTLNTANNAIKHIQRNRKLYNRIVFLFAIYMLPQFVYFGIEMITYFIRGLAMTPKERLIYEVSNVVYDCLKTIAQFLVGIEFFNILFKTLLKKLNIN